MQKIKKKGIWRKGGFRNLLHSRPYGYKINIWLKTTEIHRFTLS